MEIRTFPEKLRGFLVSRLCLSAIFYGESLTHTERWGTVQDPSTARGFCCCGSKGANRIRPYSWAADKRPRACLTFLICFPQLRWDEPHQDFVNYLHVFYPCHLSFHLHGLHCSLAVFSSFFPFAIGVFSTLLCHFM